MRREEYKGFTIIVRAFEQPESLRWRSRLNLAYFSTSGIELSPTIDLPDDYGSSVDATDAGMVYGRRSVDQHPQLGLTRNGRKGEESSLQSRIRVVFRKLAVPILCFVPLLAVVALARIKWLLRLFVYPLQFVRIIAAGWVGLHAYRFLDKVSPDQWSLLVNDSPDYAHYPPEKQVRWELAVGAVFVGLAALMLLILLSTHRLAAAFQHEFPPNDQD